MSELYEHLKRLEQNQQRLRISGTPLEVPGLHQRGDGRRGRSRKFIIGFSVAFILTGFLGGVVIYERMKPKVHETTRPAASPPPAAEPPLPAVKESVAVAPLIVMEKGQELGADPAAVPYGSDAGITHPFKEPTATRTGEESSLSRATASEKPADVPTFLSPSAEMAPGSAQRAQTSRPAIRTASDTALRMEREKSVPPDGQTGSGRVPPKEQTTSAHSGGMTPHVQSSLQVLVVAEEARRAGDWYGAEQAYREYLTSHKDPQVMNNLAAVLLARGRYAEAEQVLTRAHELNQDPEIAVNLCASLWFQGKKEAACRLARSIKEDSRAEAVRHVVSGFIKTCPPTP